MSTLSDEDRAAGWYRDDAQPGQHRFWDGERWSEDRLEQLLAVVRQRGRASETACA